MDSSQLNFSYYLFCASSRSKAAWSCPWKPWSPWSLPPAPRSWPPSTGFSYNTVQRLSYLSANKCKYEKYQQV